jgi:hypothetical protein
VEDEFVAKDFERFRIEVTSTVHSLREDTTPAQNRPQYRPILCLRR